MKLAIAAAALLLAATAAMPASAATRASGDSAAHAYRNGYHAYAAAPGFPDQRVIGWGHCVQGEASATSAFPSWDVCRSR